MKKIIKIKRAGLILVGTIEFSELKENEKCPMVIIMHGFAENHNHRILVKITEKLLEKGIASVRFDFNGQRESEGLFEDMTVTNELEDAGEILRYVKQLYFVDSVSIY